MVVVPLKSTSGIVKNLMNPDEMDIEEVGSFDGKRCVVNLAHNKRLGCFGELDQTK